MNSLAKKAFSSLYKYSNPANPRVYLSVARGGNKIGDLVFELYEDRQPAAVNNFTTMLKGNAEGQSYIGSNITKGVAGLGFFAGRTNEENHGAYGTYNADGDHDVRHVRRGMLTYVREAENCTGNEFCVTFNPAPWYDGYATAFGELVEGESVLAELEKSIDRNGNVKDDLTIVAGGHRQ